MQTIKNKQDNHVEHPNGETHSGDSDGGCWTRKGDGATPTNNLGGVEGMYVLESLQNEEDQLRKLAEKFNTEATELENMHDENTQEKAGVMRAHAGVMLDVAKELSQVISDIKADPHKKISRRRVELLRTYASSATSIGEEEIESAEAAHSGASEHKQQLRHIVEAQAHEIADIKTPKISQKRKSEKKSASAGKQKSKAVVEDAPERQRSWIERAGDTLKETKDKVVHSLAIVTETAGDIVDGVEDAFQAGFNGIKQLGKTAISVSKTVVSAITHAAPVLAVVKLGGKVVGKLGKAKDMMLGLLPSISLFGGHDADEKEEKKTATATVNSGFSHGILEAIGNMKLPTLAFDKADLAEDLLTPLVPRKQAAASYALIPIL